MVISCPDFSWSRWYVGICFSVHGRGAHLLSGFGFQCRFSSVTESKTAFRCGRRALLFFYFSPPPFSCWGLHSRSSAPGACLRVRLLLKLPSLDLVFCRPDFLQRADLLLIWFSRRADLGSRSSVCARGRQYWLPREASVFSRGETALGSPALLSPSVGPPKFFLFMVLDAHTELVGAG
jgi:hypothetical protein